MWLLGYDYMQMQRDYTQTSSLETYRKAMAQAFSEIRPLLSRDGLLVCVAGDVNVYSTRRKRRVRDVVQTASVLADICESLRPGWKIIHEFQQNVSGNQRYLHALNGSSGHKKHSLVERVFIARRA